MSYLAQLKEQVTKAFNDAKEPQAVKDLANITKLVEEVEKEQINITVELQQTVNSKSEIEAKFNKLKEDYVKDIKKVPVASPETLKANMSPQDIIKAAGLEGQLILK